MSRARLENPLPKPSWIRVRLRTEEEFGRIDSLVKDLRLNTVCKEAHCPNIFECWSHGTATFMIMGENCTRRCGFCAVGKEVPLPLDAAEPANVAEAVQRMGLRHAVITSVDRDDLPDGGAAHFASTIREVRRLNPSTAIEVLIPDFGGDSASLATVMEERPAILNHNMETVAALYRRVRPAADYRQSLRLLAEAARWKSVYPVKTKSGIMVGLGESMEEVLSLMDDLRGSECDIMTIGQYLRPSMKHLPVERYWSPEEFAALRSEGLRRGFLHVESGPLVRSSYHASEQSAGPSGAGPHPVAPGPPARGGRSSLPIVT
jgi:lipoic acid synthetase